MSAAEYPVEHAGGDGDKEQKLHRCQRWRKVEDRAILLAR